MTYSLGTRYIDQTAGAAINKSIDISPVENVVASGRRTVKTVEVNVNVSTEIAANAWMVMVNRGTTDTLSVGLATTDYIWEMRPGEMLMCRLHSSKAFNFFVIASAANDDSNFEYYLRND